MIRIILVVELLGLIGRMSVHHELCFSSIFYLLGVVLPMRTSFFVCFPGTIYNGAALLHAEGAREVYACCTHAVFRLVLL